MGIIIEVGVNTGSDTMKLLEGYPNSSYYGFEPTFQLYNLLLDNLKTNPHGFRMEYWPLAVSDINSLATFNVAGQGDWGCSSLNQFNPKIADLWQNRSDFKFTHTQPVVTIRLDTFFDNFMGMPGYDNIESIDYLWIDAQGHDLKVLESTGKYIDKVLAGRLEVAYTVELYAGTLNTKENAEKFLTDNGFKYNIVPDDVCKECNIDFWR